MAVYATCTRINRYRTTGGQEADRRRRSRRRLERPPPTPGQQPEAHDAYTPHELAAAQLHCITSVAWSSTCGGMVRPSVWAVLRLITKSKRIGCSMGRS